MKNLASYTKPFMVQAFLLGAFLCMSNAAIGATMYLKNGIGGYQGAEDFYTYFMDGGAFNSKTDLDIETLKIAPDESDSKAVMRFQIPMSSSSYRSVSRVALVLTFKAEATPDTLMVHNLNNGDLWDEYEADYNTLNGSSPWSGADGKLVRAWLTTDAVASVSGGESSHSKLVIEFHPNDSASLRALLDSWTDGNNQGFVIEGVNGKNQFYSSSAYNESHRPELIIEY